MNRSTRARYNKTRYEKMKKFERENKDSPVVQGWIRSRNEANKKYRAKLEALYGEEQKCIAAVRKARGWKQSELGGMLGVSLQTVSHWEHGRLKAPWAKLFEVMPELKEACGGAVQPTDDWNNQYGSSEAALENAV